MLSISETDTRYELDVIMRNLVCLLQVVFWAAPLLGQEVILQPPDLEPGDQYRLMFLTSQARDATSTDIDEYNAFVQQVADDAPVVGEWGLKWSVVGSTETVSARTNTGTDYGDDIEGFGVPIYRLDGVQLLSDYRALWQPPDFGAFAPGGINFTELGTNLEPHPEWVNLGVMAFTGTTISGDVAPDNYLGSERANAGTAFTASNFDWFGIATPIPSNTELPFYAMSEVITVVPEPAASMLLMVAFFVGMMSRKSRRVYGV